jgi:beta-alanine degradation protein BauB
MVLESHVGDPVVTDPALYTTIFENERVRVLEYRDQPGDTTHAHRHPDSVMITLTAFRRRVHANGQQVEVELPAAQARWLSAQSHTGENIGSTPTHSIFVELKEPPLSPPASDGQLGPAPL